MNCGSMPSRKGSSVGGNLTSRSSSGFGDDNYGFRPDTAPSNKVLPVSPLALNERAKSVPMDMKLPGKYSTSPVRPSSREFLKSDDEIENMRPKTVEISAGLQQQPLGQPWYMSMLREKEERLLQMGDEINRLSMFEAESKQKDSVIASLQKQIALQEALKAPQEAQSSAVIADLKQRLQLLGDEVLRLTPVEDECKRSAEVIVCLQNEIEALKVSITSNRNVSSRGEKRSVTPSEEISTMAGDLKASETLTEGSETTAYSDKVRTLRESIQSANEDIDALKERFDTVVPEKLTPEEEVNMMKEEIEIKNQIIFEFEEKLSAAYKELSMNEGFVTALQKDVQLRENKIMKLTTQIEKAEEKTKDAMADIRAMSKKFSDLRESHKHSDMLMAAEQELAQMKENHRHTEEVIAKLQEKAEKQSKDLRDSHRRVKRGNESDKNQKNKIEDLTRDLEEMKRQEQISRVACEHISARFERLRSRVIQSVYITPGAAHPRDLINDIVLFNAVKKIIDDRSEFHKKLEEIDPNFPPLQIPFDMTPDDEKSEDPAPLNAAPANERKSGKGGRKSPKHR